jgi:hypothetical protein
MSPFIFGIVAGAGKLFGASGYYMNNGTPYRFTYATETTSQTTMNLTMRTNSRTSIGSNAGTAGYVWGGYAGDGSVQLSTIEKIRYFFDTSVVLAATLTTPGRAGAYANNNGSVAGYVFGGFSSGSSQTNSEKMLFSNETKAAISATLPANKRLGSYFSNSGVAGYQGTGVDSAYSNTVNNVSKVTFSNDSMSTIAAMPRAVSEGAGFSNSGTAGYSLSGYNYSNGNGNGFREVYKTLYSNDTNSTLPTLTTGFPINMAGIHNQNVAGYTMANATTGFDVDRWAFPTDTKTIITNGVLVSAMNYPPGVSNSLG